MARVNRIKKGYLPYLIGEIACCVAEIVLFFFALHSDSLLAVIVALIAIAATGVGVWYAYKKFGIDLDSTGGAVVKPRDIANSNQGEVVQAFGFDLDKLWG